MALSLESISAKAAIRAPRIVLCGVEKIGKTSFATGCVFDEDGEKVAEGTNNPIVLPIRGEEGVDGIEVPAFPTLNTFDEVLEAVGVLYASEHPHRTVVIDSLSALEPLVWEHVCREHGVSGIEEVGGGYGKGYTAAVEALRLLRDGLDALRNEKNMSSILIGHVKVKRFDDPGADSYDQYTLDINDKSAALFLRWADLTLFANHKVSVKKEDVGFKKEKKRGVDVTGGARFLFTQKRPAHPGGGRNVYGRLPYELPLSWPAFETAVAGAMETKETEKS